ncbi:pectate lyase [Luteitalea pratensis]|uniref:Pectate lyase n=1 Tax=Luteitalea pratensis TaxID=1855912 RepID=A0A143PWD6_LUTPR|nr:pectate lyase [Luteitalea pratensis]AMY12518.1 pectate lyase [Luteitalea pratensis]
MTLVRLAPSLVLAGALLAPAETQEATADKVPARLTAERVAALPVAQRPAWTAYLEASDAARAVDHAALDRELRGLGTNPLARAPLGRSMDPWLDKGDAWYASDEARRIADVVISYQTPSGGWSKRLDFTGGSRQPGQGYSAEGDWSYVATFDNDATTTQMQFISRVFDAAGRTTDRDAFERGLAYVLRAQYPNGCWPQVYPLAGSYHDAATFNDDAMANVIGLLDAIAQGRHRIVAPEQREAARASAARGVACVLAAQIRVDGVHTAWGAQHDALTLAPVGARAYEHTGVDAAASARIVELLMTRPRSDAAIRAAVDAAVVWFRATAMHGYAYEKGELIARPGAGPLWPRFSELRTNRAIFGNRDAIVRYDLSEIVPERKYGYGWYTTSPARVLDAISRWQE